MVTLQLRQLHVPPGQRLLIEDVTWADFEAVVEELGEHRGTRLAYSQGVLEIVSPLPAHEKAKVIISDLVKILLDELDMSWESLGSTTFRRAEMAAGIEPDDCFYIQHHAAMVGKERLDLRVDRLCIPASIRQVLFRSSEITSCVRQFDPENSLVSSDCAKEVGQRVF